MFFEKERPKGQREEVPHHLKHVGRNKFSKPRTFQTKQSVVSLSTSKAIRLLFISNLFSSIIKQAH